MTPLTPEVGDDQDSVGHLNLLLVDVVRCAHSGAEARSLTQAEQCGSRALPGCVSDTVNLPW